MEIHASSKFVRIGPRKVRLIADAVKKLPLTQARAQLRLLNKRAAGFLSKTLESTISNAVNNQKVVESDLYIKAITVDEGPAFKRFHPVSRGMAHGYKKRTSHIHVTLATRAKPVIRKNNEPVKAKLTEEKKQEPKKITKTAEEQKKKPVVKKAGKK